MFSYLKLPICAIVDILLYYLLLLMFLYYIYMYVMHTYACVCMKTIAKPKDFYGNAEKPSFIIRVLSHIILDSLV